MMNKVRISRMLTAALALVMMVSLVGVASAATDTTNATYTIGEGQTVTAGTVTVGGTQHGVVMEISANSANSMLACQLVGDDLTHDESIRNIRLGNAVWPGLDPDTYTATITNDGDQTTVTATLYAM